MATLSEILRGGLNGGMSRMSDNMSRVTENMSRLPASTSPVKRILPNGGGSYVAAGPAQKQIFQGPTPPPAQSSANPDAEWFKPDGTKYTADEVVANRASALTGRGAIPQYAGDAAMKPNQTLAELNRTNAGMTNASNDIATGTTDPYGIASKSGIAYSPAEMKAIEKAYAGVYDPALVDVHTKLEARRKADELASTRSYDFEKMKQEHQYRLAEASAKAGAGASSNGTQYTVGTDPIVDGWVERLNRTGENIQTAIPGVANQALRNKVMLGMNSTKFNNPATGERLQSVNSITQLLANPELENISGFVGQVTGGLWGDAKKAKDMYDQQVAKLELGASQLLKGQGAVSDNERRILEKASTYLKRGQSDEDFRNGLIQMRGAFMTASGLEAPVKITDPSSGESQVQNLSTHEIEDFIRDGAIVEYSE